MTTSRSLHFYQNFYRAWFSAANTGNASLGASTQSKSTESKPAVRGLGAKSRGCRAKRFLLMSRVSDCQAFRCYAFRCRTANRTAYSLAVATSCRCLPFAIPRCKKWQGLEQARERGLARRNASSIVGRRGGGFRLNENPTAADRIAAPIVERRQRSVSSNRLPRCCVYELPCGCFKNTSDTFGPDNMVNFGAFCGMGGRMPRSTTMLACEWMHKVGKSPRKTQAMNANRWQNVVLAYHVQLLER